MAVSAPPPRTPAQPPDEPPHKPPEPPKDGNFANWKRLPRWARWGLIALSVILVIGAVGAIAGTNNTKSSHGTTSRQPTPKALPETALSVSNNYATVKAPYGVLSGTTTPGATVQVNSTNAIVEASGNWHARVNLQMGGNTFTVRATAPGHRSAAVVASLTREMSPAEKAAAAAAEAKRKQEAAAAEAKRKQEAAAAAAAERQNFINAAKTIPYNQLIKDPTSYAGQKVAYRGQIFQIIEEGGQGVMLLSVTDEGYGLWNDEIWVNYSQHVASAKDDIITVYGTVVGMKTYDTQIGGSRDVPEIDAKYIVEGG